MIEQPSDQSDAPGASDMIRPDRLAHIVFRTPRLQAMVDWYCTLLCAEVVFQNDDIAFLTYDDEHHRIALMRFDNLLPRPEGMVTGFYHAAFAYRDLGTLLANYERLKGLGMLPWRPIIHGPTVSLYYRDPDGNDIETQVDAFDTAAEATAWMQGEAFARNPIGVMFDPEEMLQRHRAGVSDSELKQRPDA